MTSEWLLLTLHHLGVVVYGGSVIAFAVLLGLAPRLERLDERAVMGVFRAWGSGLGLSMGALIFGGLGAWYLQHGGLTWDAGTESDLISLFKLGFFVVLWASSFVLEIWTLDPIRKPSSADSEAWRRAYGRVVSQLSINALLVVVIGALGVAAGLA